MDANGWRLVVEQPYDPDNETMIVCRSATGYLVMTTGGRYVELQS